MRKFYIVIMIMVFSIPLLGTSQAPIRGISLKDFTTDSAIFQSLELKSAQELGDIIILPDGSFNKKEAAEIITRLDKLPPSILSKINREGIHVNLFTGKLTDQPTASHLKGLIPRGYKNKTTWDDVPGMGGSQTVLVKIGASEKGNGHGSVNLELHELAHSVDLYVFQEIRYDPVFLKIWKQECPDLFTGQAYFNTFPEEYFAETFAMFYLGKETQEKLKIEAPKTFEFFQTLQ
jgi:Pro-Pro endopeptidase